MCCSALSIRRWIASRRYLTLAPSFTKSGGCRKSRRRLMVATETFNSSATRYLAGLCLRTLMMKPSGHIN